MATTFGIFWTTEGLKIEWPYSDTTLILIAALVLLASFACITWLRTKRPGRMEKASKPTKPESKIVQAFRSVFGFIYELLIGDEWITGFSVWLLVAAVSAVSISSDAWYLIPVYFVVILPIGLRKQIAFQK